MAQTYGAPLKAQADPTDTAYMPRPDWYFYGLYQLLRIFRGSRDAIGSIVFPFAFFLALLALPFVDRSPERALYKRRLVICCGAGTFVLILALTIWGGYEGLHEVKEAAKRRAVSDTSAPAPDTGDPELGRRLFAELKCASCHDRPFHGVNIPPGLELAGSKYQPTVYCILPTTYCLLYPAYCLLYPAYYLLSTVSYLLSTAYCLLYPTYAASLSGALAGYG